MIPLQVKLYLVVGVAFILGVLGIRAKWMHDGEEKVRRQLADKRLKAIKEAEDVRSEVEALDRDTLRSRSTVWVRKSKR